MFGRRDYPKIHDRASILSFVRARLDANGRLPDPVCALPDEKEVAPDQVAWMAGALDGVMTHHMGAAGDVAEVAQALARLIVTASAEPRRRQLTALYTMLVREDVLSLIDPVIRELALLRPPISGIGRLATWLASESPDRGPVKVGIALLGITGAPDGILLHELGAHEELTLYAAVAFCNARANPDPDLFALAQRVQGWGRIHCVERLRDTSDPTIARWILTEGFRNSVMNEYLAYIAATTGNLAAALAEPAPEPAVLAAARDIIDALLVGGPAEDISDYRDAPLALSRWLGHVERGTGTVGDFMTIQAIKLHCEDTDWDDRLRDGTWTASAREEIHSTATRLLGDPRWAELVRTALESPNAAVVSSAERAARLLGIDAFDRLVALIEADPLGGPWFEAWQGADRDRAQVLVELAARVLDLDAIATGPSTAIGIGPQFKPHMALNWTLQALRDHPGLGVDLIAAAMKSPSVQNRHGALNVLEATGPDGWSTSQREQLAVLASTDPDEKVRQRAVDLLGASDPS